MLDEAPRDDTMVRPFGLWTVIALVVGGMIGSGIFMLPASVAPFGWTGVLAWLVSIAGVLAIAYALGRLTALMPHADGAIEMTGAVLGPLAAVLIGWSYWISCWTAVATIAISATGYLSVFWPALSATPPASATTSIALIWALTLFNLRGARAVGRFQVATTLLKLLPLLAVLAILAALGIARSAPLAPLPPAPHLLDGFPAAITLTLFPLIGFEAASVVTARVRDPARNVMRATMLGTALTGLLYLLVCSGIVLVLPAAQVAASSAPIALFVDRFWGRGAGLGIALFAVIAAIGALNCWVLIQGEVLRGMARAGLLPGWFARVSARVVPVRGTLFSSMCASLLIATTASRSLNGIFTLAALLSTCSALYLYVGACAAAWFKGVARGAALVGAGFCLWAMWGAGLEASGLGLLLTLCALPLYWLRPAAAPRPEPAAALV